MLTQDRPNPFSRIRANRELQFTFGTAKVQPGEYGVIVGYSDMNEHAYFVDWDCRVYYGHKRDVVHDHEFEVVQTIQPADPLVESWIVKQFGGKSYHG